MPTTGGAAAAEVDADVILLGAGVAARSGPSAGTGAAPRALRAASASPRPFSLALGVDYRDALTVLDGGDVTPRGRDVEASLAAVAARVEQVARAGGVPGLVGGDQTVTLAALRGLSRAKLRHPGLLHFDALVDGDAPADALVRPGEVVRRAVEERLVTPSRVTLVGARGPVPSAQALGYARSSGFEVVTTDDVRWDLHGAVTQIRESARRGPLYLSVDVSVFDPAFVPAVAAPVPGGLDTWSVQQLLRALVGAEIVGFDLVGLAPARDLRGVGLAVAAGVLEEILAAIADTRRSAPSDAATGRGREQRRSP